MPEFAMQLEQASGLPWWCLLALTVLVVVVVVLAVALGRARRKRSQASGLVNNEVPAAGEDPEAADAEVPAGEEPGQAPEDAPKDSPADGAPAGDDAAVAAGEGAEEGPSAGEVPADAAPGQGAAPDPDAAPSVDIAVSPDDEELLKATGGEHARLGHSAFGVDFGFLEEYEADYERAVAEFRRFRKQVDEPESGAGARPEAGGEGESR